MTDDDKELFDMRDRSGNRIFLVLFSIDVVRLCDLPIVYIFYIS
jgi:hypothetical protein